MRKKTILITVATVVVAVAAAAWFGRKWIAKTFFPSEHAMVLYGNVDNRQLELAFLVSERIAELLPEEGTKVAEGEYLGCLETVRLEDDVAAARAEVANSRAALALAKAQCEKAENGSRAEDVAMARFGSEAIAAKLNAAALEFHRQKVLRDQDASSEAVKEAAEAEYLFLNAGLRSVRSYLDRLTAGERPEDIAAARAKVAQAEAGVQKAEAELAICERRLADSKLYAPRAGIVRSRLLEPGELASPQRPVISLAVTSPKWVRVYLPETYLTKVAEGDRAVVHADGAEADFEGWLGFVSPVAEFTPRNIETPELRTSLVYEARVYLEDPENRLKTGAPVTVTFSNTEVR